MREYYPLQWVNVHTCMNSISTLGTYVNAYLNHHRTYDANMHVSTLDETNSRTHYSTMWLYDRLNSGSYSDWGNLYHSQDFISMLVHQLPSFISSTMRIYRLQFNCSYLYNLHTLIALHITCSTHMMHLNIIHLCDMIMKCMPM